MAKIFWLLFATLCLKKNHVSHNRKNWASYIILVGNKTTLDFFLEDQLSRPKEFI